MKSAKNLLIPLIVMILLAIGVVAYFVVDRISKNHTVETTYNTVDLLYVSPVEISSVSVLHRDSKAEIRVDMTRSADGTYVYKYLGSDKGSDVYSQSEMSEFLSTMASFVTCSLISENANLSEYGLDAPAFTVTVTKTDGTAKVILIGNVSPDGNKCYICASSSNSVYMANIEKYKVASKIGNDFIDDRLFEAEMKDLESVSFYRKKDSVELSGTCVYDEENDDCTFKFNKPFSIESSSFFDRLINNICRMSVAGYEDPTTENLSKFGLGVPQFRVTLNLKGGKVYTVEFSSVMGGYYYGRVNGTGKIFKADASRIELIESPVLSLISEYVFHDTCDNVDSVECTGTTGKFVLKLDVKKEMAISDSNSVVSLDGRNAKVSSESGRSYAAMLYETIFGINIGGIDESAVISENAYPDTTIKIYDHNHSVVVYDFYRRSDETFYVSKNGEYTGFYVFKRELYNDGGQDTYNYGVWPAYDILTKAISNGINGVYEIPEQK